MGQLHSGIHQQLDDAATEMIRKSLEGVTSMAAKSDILTPWKDQDRKRREVYSAEGAPDGALRRGMFYRAWNSTHRHLNSVDGKVPLPADLRTGGDPRFHRDENAVEMGEVYDLRIYWGSQIRIKCPICSKYVRGDTLEVVCRCGSVFSKVPEEGHYQVVRINDGR
jgi:hypothetical protein